MPPSSSKVNQSPSSTTACDCAHHRARPGEATTVANGYAALFPILACLLCPACLTTYAQILSFAGIGVSLTEDSHHLLLVGAIALSLAVSAWRSLRLRRWMPLAVTAAGCGLLVLSHELDENAALMWTSVMVLLGGGILERHLWKRHQAAALSVHGIN